MTKCKERNIFEEAKPAKEYPADWFVIPALDAGRYIKNNFVSLSDFEALRLQNEGLSSALTRYKNKVKQTIKSQFVPENITVNSVTDDYGNEWMLTGYSCPKCNNEYPPDSNGNCSQCKLKKVKHELKWILIGSNPHAQSKEKFIEELCNYIQVELEL